jgi:hypothetical protein
LTSRDKNVDVAVTVIKYCYSMARLIFSLVIVISLIFTEQTKLSESAHPVVPFLLICFLLLWLAMMEGGRGDLVGLQTIDKELYKDSHPITLRRTSIAHTGDNMERFIVGRQLLVVLAVFITNLSGAAVPDCTSLDFRILLPQ